MFKNLKTYSKKILVTFTSITLVGAIVLTDNNLLNKIYGLFNNFEVKNIEAIEKERGKIITKDYLTFLVIKSNNNTQDINSFIIDSNLLNEKSLTHPIGVKGIYDTITNSFDKYINSTYLPIDSENLNNNPNINYIDYINIIAKESKDKIVFINESFIDYLDINKDDILSLDSLAKYKDKIKLLKEVNNELITILNDNPNIVISKGAGNYDKILENKNELLTMFQKLSNDNYELTKELIPFLNLIIKNKIDEKLLNPNLKDFLIDFQELCKFKNVNYDDFISHYIKDYLIHYDRIDLLEKSNLLQKDNPFGLQQLFIVEALDLNQIKDNLMTYKKYNTNINLKELEDDINKLDISKNLQYNAFDLIKLDELYEKYKDKYKEIFSFTKYGSLSSLMYKENDILKTSFHGQNANKIESSMGTSFSSPYFLSKYVVNYTKEHILDLKNMINEYNNSKINLKNLDD